MVTSRVWSAAGSLGFLTVRMCDSAQWWRGDFLLYAAARVEGSYTGSLGVMISLRRSSRGILVGRLGRKQPLIK